MFRRLIILLLALFLSTGAITTNDVPNVYWEIHRYTPEDIELIDSVNGGNHSNLLGRIWWMQAHPATDLDSYVTIAWWAPYGWFNLYWSENLTDQHWYLVATSSTPFTDLHVTHVHLHPSSEVSQKIKASRAGFFRVSDGHIYCIDLSQVEDF